MTISKNFSLICPQWIVAMLGVLPFAILANAQPIGARPPGDLSLKLELERAIAKGTEWLVENQDGQGFWSTSDHPAVTGLAVRAMAHAPGAKSEKVQKSIDDALEFILSKSREDGGIYVENNLPNYNTSVCLMALLAADEDRYRSRIIQARNFLIGRQQDLGEKGRNDTPLDGGLGYGRGGPTADMSNTVLALEALYHSKHLLEDQNSADAKNLNWDAAIQFLEKCQNLPSHNKESWATGDPENLGGFVYYPGNTKAGEMTLESGEVALRSYGSISYAGLLSYIYADLDKQDPRVQAVLAWLQAHFTLEENPGMGAQGLFYYYHTMAKALTVSQTDRIQLKSGETVPWRVELSKKLLNEQKPDGSWMNDNGRWWEKDPSLVTSYILIALEYIHSEL